MTKGGARIVARIEKAFVAYSKERVNHVSFTQLKDWLNSNTREGISSPRLGAYLKRTPKFVGCSRTPHVRSASGSGTQGGQRFSTAKCTRTANNERLGGR